MTLPRVRLSELGSDPASVLRLVSHFDSLDEELGSADDVVRAAALVAECPVTARTDSRVVIRYDGDGNRLSADAGTVPSAGVWLDRPEPAHALDAVVIDRLRHILRRRAVKGITPPHLGDPALVEIVISSKEHRADRGRAIRLLGFDETRDVRVLAVSTDAPATLTMVFDAMPETLVRTATLGQTVAVLCQGTTDARALGETLEAAISAAFPAPLAAGSSRGPWIGIGSSTGVFAAFQSWQEAYRALRFASSTGYGRRAIAYERLSVLELLADLPPENVMKNRDVLRINEIAATPHGALEVRLVVGRRISPVASSA